ncbi:MAG: glycosyl hydrolase, partial [Flavitalea sp.]
AWFGNEFNRKNTWYYDMDVFLQYIKRSNMMLQQGNFVADIAYFISEDAPKMTGTTDPALPLGYAFDYINAEVIKTRTTVKNGRLVLPDGMSYKILVLPKLETMRPEFLQKVKELVKEGAVVLGPKPLRSPSLQNYGKADKQLLALTKELWGNIDGKSVKTNDVGKGMVIDGMELKEALELVNVRPDFLALKTDSVLYIHRKVDESSIYFISNQAQKEQVFNAEFRVNGLIPELWNPVTGAVTRLDGYSSADGVVTVPIKLAAIESAFIVFREPGKTSGSKVDEKTLGLNYPAPANTLVPSQDWVISFDKAMRGPVNPVRSKELFDWTTSANDSVKYFSGSATYSNSFVLNNYKSGSKVVLNLGQLSAIAKVKVNGVDAGGAWTAPYQVDVSKFVRNGNNTFEVRVVNTWVNRMIGDSKMPEAERPSKTFNYTYKPESRLLTAGLFGPVKVMVY